MSFARYMELALTQDPHGYYMKRDVFNTKGDFITSPEISQMFGEMLGFWVIHFFSKIGCWDTHKPKNNKKISLLEFGPGRGTLMKDIVRVLSQFNCMRKIEINFVEASPFLQKEQQETLKNLMKEKDIWLTYKEFEQQTLDLGHSAEELSEATTKFSKCEKLFNIDHDISFNWFQTYEAYLAHNQEALRKDKACPVLFICHEFFDALPIMIFEKLENGWVEKLVDNNPDLGQK